MIIENIAYAPEHGERGMGDLFLPGKIDNAPTMLLIHGGGWRNMDKSSIAPIANFAVASGWAVFSVNYRLINQAPWPACGDDCLRAAFFLLENDNEYFKRLDREKIVVAGASAGGHLALMAGLKLPPEKVRAVISMAGPSDLSESNRFKKQNRDRYAQNTFSVFFGKDDYTEDELDAASPLSLVTEKTPPVFCIHSSADELVIPYHSEKILEIVKAKGGKAIMYSFPGKDKNHGFWVDGGGEEKLSERKIVEPVQQALRDCLNTC